MIRNWINLKGFGNFESPIQEQAREIVDGDYLRQQQEEDERGVTAATSLHWKTGVPKTWGVGKFGMSGVITWKMAEILFWLEDSLFWNSGTSCKGGHPPRSQKRGNIRALLTLALLGPYFLWGGIREKGLGLPRNLKP